MITLSSYVKCDGFFVDFFSFLFMFFIALILHQSVRIQNRICLARQNCSEEISLRAIEYLFAFPAAFMLSGVLSESLFLLLVVACFLLAKKEQWLWCGILGMFASLVKPHGIVLFLPLLWANYRCNKGLKTNMLWLFLIPCGPLLFAAYTWHLTGDFLAYIHVKKSGWSLGVSNPLSRLVDDLRSARFYISLQTFASAILAGLLIAYRKKIDSSHFLFGVMFIIFQTFFWAGPSILRYYTAIFPLYIALAKMSANKRLDDIVPIGFGIVQTFLFITWVTGKSMII